MPERLGFVGLGIMGAPMVRRLLACGFDVTVWNLEPERAAEVVPRGAVWAESPAAVREAAEIVCTCVFDGAAVREVSLGTHGFASAAGGADLLLDFSTVPPQTTRQIAGELQARAGMSWLDAPISGGPGPAEKGELAAMLGGREEDVARARPVLQALTRNATHMGPLGAGQVTKTLNQAIVGTNYVLMAEVIALATGAGIDPARLPEALAGGLADSAILQSTYKQMAAGDFDPPRAYGRQLAKDLEALREFAEDQGGDVPLIEQAVRTYTAFVRDGNEFADAASISQYVINRRARHSGG